jgi:glyoxylase-like metal-dependent hydrolase (beta-lactamase superfamily II)
MSHRIEPFFDERTNTLTYVVSDPATRDAIVIDPVLDYEPAASRTFTESVEKVVDYLKRHELTLHAILETHAHADHLSGSQLVKQAFPQARIAIGARITEVQEVFKHVFDLPTDFPTDGRQFDLLLNEGETYRFGTIQVGVLYTPGHTPACATYRIEDALFTGDALFMPDSGTGRCDFPGGSARDLYRSVQTLYELPDELRVFTGHDYRAGGKRDVAWEARLGEHKRNNVALRADTAEEDFVRFREGRDAKLDAPKLLFQSVQVNVDAGRLPEPGDNEIRYLRIPINVFRPEKAGTVVEERV